MTKLDAIIRTSLTRFTDFVFTSKWYGKEREAVSLYAFGFLIDECASGTCLYDKQQIGIEVRVPKPTSFGRKSEVCKDLVIWPSPRMTCWNEQRESVIYPVSVMEWKANRTTTFERDLQWLTAFAHDVPDFVGYATTFDLAKRKFRLKCDRVTSRKTD